MQVLNPFSNGVALGRADALFRGPGSWRVFLFLSSGPRQIDVKARSASEAIAQAWAKLKEERKVR